MVIIASNEKQIPIENMKNDAVTSPLIIKKLLFVLGGDSGSASERIQCGKELKEKWKNI